MGRAISSWYVVQSPKRAAAAAAQALQNKSRCHSQCLPHPSCASQSQSRGWLAVEGDPDKALLKQWCWQTAAAGQAACLSSACSCRWAAHAPVQASFSVQDDRAERQAGAIAHECTPAHLVPDCNRAAQGRVLQQHALHD